MSQKYLGGVISRSGPEIIPPVEGAGGTAPGVWTVEQAMQLDKENRWPVPPPPPILTAYAAGAGDAFANGDNSTAINTTYGVIGTVPKTNWSMLAARQFGGHGIDATNTLFSWGQSAASGDSATNQVPTQIGTAGQWVYIYSGLIIALGIKTDGTLWGWGSGLGAGTGAAANATPTKVGTATNWVLAVNGEQHSGGIRADGTLWMWGLNTTYQLGDNTTTQRNTPVQIGVATTWAQLSCGNDVHTAAVRTDGTLWGWGSTANGRLGVVGGAAQQVPTQIGVATNWRKVQCGTSSTVALKTDGTLWAIGGLNATGELGQGNTTAVTSPVQIGVATNWVDVVLTNSTTMAINSAGELWCCGDNSNYLYGNGSTTPSTSLTRTTAVSGVTKLAASSRNAFIIITT